MPYVSSIKNIKGETFYFNVNKINNHTVNADVPANAVFTDTTYKLFTNETNADKGGLVPIPDSTIPQADKENSFLAADGVWRKIDDSIDIKSALKWVIDADQTLQSTLIGDVTNNTATAQYSIACGQNTKADKPGQLVIGKYNQFNSNNFNDIFTIGNGTSSERKTIFNITKQGDIYLNLENNEVLMSKITALGWTNDVITNLYGN